MRRNFVHCNSGYTFIELMIAAVIASFMSLGVMSVYLNQSTDFNTETQRDYSLLEANRAFDIISRLVRQAHKDSFKISYTNNTALNTETTPEIPNDAISVEFTIPSGFSVWPNDSYPYQQNKIRLNWQNSESSGKSYIIQIGNATAAGAVPDSALKPLAGDNQGDLARIVNLDVWPMATPRLPATSSTATSNGGYLIRVTTRAANADPSYINPYDSNGPLKHYRTYTVSGIVTPRN